MASLTSVASPARPRNGAWGALSVSSHVGPTQASCPSVEEKRELATFSLGGLCYRHLPAADPWEGAGAGRRQLTPLRRQSGGGALIPKGKATGMTAALYQYQLAPAPQKDLGLGA